MIRTANIFALVGIAMMLFANAAVSRGATEGALDGARHRVVISTDIGWD